MRWCVAVLFSPAVKTYMWVLESELVPLVDELMRTELATDRLDVLVDVLVLAQEGLEHVVLFAGDLAPYRLLLAALTPLHQILLLELV